MSTKDKYLKYKNKYLKLLNDVKQKGGSKITFKIESSKSEQIKKYFSELKYSFTKNRINIEESLLPKFLSDISENMILTFREQIIIDYTEIIKLSERNTLTIKLNETFNLIKDKFELLYKLFQMQNCKIPNEKHTRIDLGLDSEFQKVKIYPSFFNLSELGEEKSKLLIQPKQYNGTILHDLNKFINANIEIRIYSFKRLYLYSLLEFYLEYTLLTFGNLTHLEIYSNNRQNIWYRHNLKKNVTTTKHYHKCNQIIIELINKFSENIILSNLGVIYLALKLILEVIQINKIDEPNKSKINSLSNLFILNYNNISLLIDFINHTLLYIIQIIISFNHTYIKRYITSDDIKEFDISMIIIDLDIILDKLYKVSDNKCSYINNILVNYDFFGLDDPFGYIDLQFKLENPKSYEEINIDKIYFIHTQNIINNKGKKDHFVDIIDNFNLILNHKLYELKCLTNK